MTMTDVRLLRVLNAWNGVMLVLDEQGVRVCVDVCLNLGLLLVFDAVAV